MGMKYLYRNVKTGEVVETSTKVSGGNWEPVEPEQPEQENQEPEQPEQENQEPEQPRQRRKKE